MTKLRIIFTVAFCVILCGSALPESHVEAATKASYVMKNEKVTWKDGDIVRGIVSFQYPKLKGNSNEITEINKVLENAMTVYMADERVEWIKETTLAYIDNKAFSENTEQLYWKTTCKITYNANNIISMHMKEMWYAGGVYNQYDYGYTFDLTTGKTLTAVDVIGGKSEEVTSKVLSSAKKYFKIKNIDIDADLWKDISTTISAYDAKDFKFFLKPGKAYICFGSYELNLGTGYQIFSVTSKYK
ncbi:MAG TPA: DUF4163 domain-containing protein [Mobilitalea sp.]|nr:DUF4163 domain-containing protein [Mobilitalea sp.]